jgi:hypothetical protein
MVVKTSRIISSNKQLEEEINRQITPNILHLAMMKKMNMTRRRIKMLAIYNSETKRQNHKK